MYLVDSHCHLDRLDYQLLHKDIDDVLTKAAIRDVKFFLTVSTTLSNYRSIRKLIGDRNNVFFSCGIHPLNQNETYSIDEFHLLAEETGVIAVGETGLDYYHKSKTQSQQKISFCNHICIGRKLNKPVIVHTRNASADTLMILKEERAMDCGGVLHSFTGDKEMAGKVLDLGFYISFSGIVTFSNAEQLRDIVRYVPLNRILLETDSPYLTPVPHRGTENQPAMIRNIAECIAELKRINIDELAHATTENFMNLFCIDSDYLQAI